MFYGLNIGFWFSIALSQRLHWVIKLVYTTTLLLKRRVPEPFEYPPFPVCLCLFMLAFTYRHLHFHSLKCQTKAYLCKILGNLPSSFQHIGACLTFTRAPLLSNSRLQHLWPLNSLSVSPSTCQRQPAMDCQHIRIPAAGTLVLAWACIVWENALHLPCCCFTAVSLTCLETWQCLLGYIWSRVHLML